MYKHETKTWHRLVAFVLSFVMVLGMLPANVVRAEEISQPVEEEAPETKTTVLQGTVGVLTPGGIVDGSTALFANMTLTEVPADASIGRNVDGWWVGAKVMAPADLDISNALYGRKGAEKTSFQNDVITENGETFLPLWVLVNEEYAVKYETINYTWTFDWDGDQVDDQTVKISIDSKSITLVREDGTEVFPAPYGEGNVTTLIEGGTVAGEVVTFANTTLQWDGIDETVGRKWEGWWVGVRVHAPVGMTEEQLQNALYGNPKNEERTTFASEMSKVDGEYVVDLWFLVNEQYLTDYNPLSYTRVFDWNGDGYAEQTVKTVIDPATVILMKDEQQVYPEIPYITIEVSVTDNAEVMIDDEVVSGTVELVENVPVTVKIAPKELGDAHVVPQSLLIAGQAYEADENGQYTGTFTFAQGDTIEVVYTTMYDVTFIHGNGQLIHVDGNVLENSQYAAGTELQFTYEPTTSFTLEAIKANGQTLTADKKGVYTVTINGTTEIEAVTADKQPPVFSNVTVSDPDTWTTSKTITFEVNDNVGVNAVYLFTTDKFDDPNAERREVQLKDGKYSVTVTAVGTYYLYAVDSNMNYASYKQEVANIDTTAPEIGEVSNYGLWMCAAIKDDESGIKECWAVEVDEDGNEVRTIQLSLLFGQYGFTPENGKTYYFYAMNHAGLVTSTAPVQNLDTAGPEISNVATSDWSTVSNKVTFSVADISNAAGDPAGLEGVLYTKIDYTLEEFKALNVRGMTAEELTAAGLTLLEPENGEYGFEVQENGTYYIWAWDKPLQDGETVSVPNYSTQSVTLDHIDVTGPTITVTPNIDMSEEATKDKVVLTATFEDKQPSGFDGSGVVTLYYSDVSATDPSAESVDVTGKTEYQINVPHKTFDGTYYVWVKDAMGNVSEVVEVTVNIDTGAPVVLSFTYSDPVKIDGDTRIYGRDGLTLTVSASDNKGVHGFAYKMVPLGATEEDIKNIKWNSYSAENFTTTEEFTFEIDRKDGTEFIGYIYVHAWDQSRNYSKVYESTQLIIIDNKTPAAPNLTINGIAQADWEEDNWYSSMVIHAAVEDDDEPLSGVDHYEYSTDPEADVWTVCEDGELTINTNTHATYYFRAVSNSGVAGKEQKLLVKVQSAPPAEASVTVSEPDGTNDWYTTAPVITITPAEKTDNGPKVTTWYCILPAGQDEIKAEQWTEAKGVTKLDEHNDGFYVLYVKTTDEAGNETLSFSQVSTVKETITDEETGEVTEKETEVSESKENLPFKVDATAPTGLSITATYEQVKMQEKKDENGETVLDENGNPVMEPVLENGIPAMETITDDLLNNSDVTVFNKFYDTAITIELGANFDISDEGSLKYLILPNYGEYTNNEATYADSTNWNDYNGGVTINPDEKFVLIFRAEDAAGNVAFAHSTGIIVDESAPSGAPAAVNMEADFNYPEPDGENEFYTNEEGFDISVSIYDPTLMGTLLPENGSLSGLESISYKLSTTEDSKDEQILSGDLMVVNETVIASAADETATVDGLIAKWDATIHVDPEKFNGNTVYLEITAVDKAGNSRTFKSSEMKIDISDPVVSVTFTPATGNNGSKYFNVTRTATVKVEERNFDPERTNVTITAELDGHAIEIPAVEFTQDPENTDIWTANIDFRNDGDYTFEVNVTDLAGNDVTDEEVNYGEYPHTHEFTIDKLLPAISVSYSNDNASNGKYFNEPRTVTVRVEERNFDPDNTSITINANLNGQPVAVPAYDFVQNGNIWTAVITLAEDGDYTFSAAATDKAGNSAETINYGTSVAPTEFTIDTTIENPAVGGVEDGGAYKDEVTPSVDITDVNYENHEIVLTRTNMQAKDEDVTEDFINYVQIHAQGATVNYEDFPHIPENDGIYTLTVTMSDKAGNTITTTTTFTVNRFGSVYVPGEYLRDEVQDGYLTDVEEDLTLTEYNPDQLEDGSVRIEITRDGKPLDNVDFDVTPTPNQHVSYGESGWYEYAYTISKDNFTEDGIYKITIISKDNTGNECQSEIITFRVDKTAPELSSVVGLEEPIVNAQELTVSYTVFDAIGLQSVIVYVNGVPVEEITNFDDPNNFSGTFTLTESNDAQSVRIVITDLAGNVLDTDAEGFTSAYVFNDKITVSTNWFVRWFANKPLFFGSLAGGAGGLWLLWFLIFGKRKKEDEEEQAG